MAFSVVSIETVIVINRVTFKIQKSLHVDSDDASAILRHYYVPDI